jgi:hypothetical protein
MALATNQNTASHFGLGQQQTFLQRKDVIKHIVQSSSVSTTNNTPSLTSERSVSMSKEIAKAMR